MVREPILLRRRATPKQVTLPSRETFAARYERTSRRNLPRNIIVRRTKRTGPRNQQKRRVQLHRKVTVRRTQKSGSFLVVGSESSQT